MKLHWLTFILLMAGNLLTAQNNFPADIQVQINKEVQFLENTISTSGNSRSVEDLKQTAIASVFTSEAIRSMAKKEGVTATDEEAVTALLPLLTRNGLIDPLAEVDWRTDSNVLRWLQAQGRSSDDLLAKGRDFALYMKLCRQNIAEISKTDLEKYVEKNPSLVELPDRIQLHITQFSAPKGLSRSVQNLAVTGMDVGMLRSATDEVKLMPPPSSAYDRISYWFPLPQLDPVLLNAVSGLRVGDKFGPVKLSNGSLIAGEVKGYRERASLPTTDALISNILFSLAAEKKGQEVFENAAQYLANTRGFWSSAWNKVKKGFKYVTAAGGGVGGFLLGGPQGAMAGAKLGWGIGGALQSWYRNPSRVPQSAIPGWSSQDFMANYRQQAYFPPPPYFQIPQYPMPTSPANSYGASNMVRQISQGYPWERPVLPTMRYRPPSYHRGVPPMVIGVFY